MFAKSVTLFLAAAATLGVTAVPAAAEAQPWGYGGSSYDRGYDDGWGRGNVQEVRYRRDNRRYYRNGYRNDYRGGRCADRGTGGLAIGAIAGGLLGNQVVGRRGDRTLGTVLGAGVGALAGRAIDKSDGRPC